MLNFLLNKGKSEKDKKAAVAAAAASGDTSMSSGTTAQVQHQNVSFNISNNQNNSNSNSRFKIDPNNFPPNQSLNQSQFNDSSMANQLLIFVSFNIYKLIIFCSLSQFLSI